MTVDQLAFLTLKLACSHLKYLILLVLTQQSLKVVAMLYHYDNYATRIECATNYYQSDCSVYCIPTNDTTGHYTCDTNGNKICLPGYTNASNNCLDGML